MSFLTQVIIAVVAGLGTYAVFRRRPLILHHLLMAMYIFRYELTNKISFVLLLTWLLNHLINEKSRGAKSGNVILWIGGAIFACRALSYLTFSGAVDGRLVMRETIVTYVNCVIWAYLVAITLEDIRSVMNLLVGYALMRSIESGLGGLMLYHFPDTALQFVLEKRDLAVEAENTLAGFSRDERLMSLGGLNPVDTSFHLALSIIILIGRMIGRIRLIYVVAALVCTLSLVYTWSRTGWLGLVLGTAILSVALYSRRALGKYIFALLLAGAVLFSQASSIQERYYTDSRNTGESTIALRVNLQTQYISKIMEFGPFGVGLPNPEIPLYLNINPPISCESMLLSALVETGWIGGALFYALIGGMFLKSFRVFLRQRGTRLQNPDGYATAVLILAMYVTLMAMALSFYLSWSDSLIWVSFGLIAAMEKSDLHNVQKTAHLTRQNNPKRIIGWPRVRSPSASS